MYCVQLCKTDSSDQLTCVIPILNLPAEFYNLTDTSLAFTFNDPSVDRSSVTAYNDYNSTLDFTETVLLDDVAYQWWNESFDLQFISLLPTISDSGLYVFNATPLIIRVFCIVLYIYLCFCVCLRELLFSLRETKLVRM